MDVENGTQLIELLAAAIWLGLADTPVGPEYYGFDQTPVGANYSGWLELTRTDLACQLAVNLVDYIDNASGVSRLARR